MTLEEWKSLQNEYGFKIIDADYENMSIEKAKEVLETLKDRFDDIFEDDKGEE